MPDPLKKLKLTSIDGDRSGRPTKNIVRPGAKQRQGWDGEHLRRTARLYGERGGCKVQEDLWVRECANLVDTVIKGCYPGVHEDHYDRMHTLALEKLWRVLVKDWKVFAEETADPGALLYTVVRNVLCDYWRGEKGRHPKHEPITDTTAMTHRHRDNPVELAIYHEMQGRIYHLMLEALDTFRFKNRFGPVWQEYVKFYFKHHRSPTYTELTSVSIFGCDRVTFQAVAYHFRKHMQRIWNGQSAA